MFDSFLDSWPVPWTIFCIHMSEEKWWCVSPQTLNSYKVCWFQEIPSEQDKWTQRFVRILLASRSLHLTIISTLASLEMRFDPRKCKYMASREMTLLCPQWPWDASDKTGIWEELRHLAWKVRQQPAEGSWGCSWEQWTLVSTSLSLVLSSSTLGHTYVNWEHSGKIPGLYNLRWAYSNMAAVITVAPTFIHCWL